MLPIEVIPVNLGIVNAYIVKQDGVILIDTGYPKSEDVILRTMQGAGIRPGDLRLILVTHGHGDHAGSVARLREMTGARVAVHKNDAGMLRAGKQGELKATGITGKVFGIFLGGEKKSRYPALEPDILVSETLDLEAFGVRGKAVAMPGHSAGSISVILENGDAFTGDLIFPSIPLGKPCLPFWADDPAEVYASVRKLLAYQPKIMYPGHGGPFSADAVRQMTG